MSSFSGKLKEFPHISVDRFDGRNLASTAYFLSHAHSDHMVGLSSPQFLDHLESNSGVYLYCSVITARFLQASIRHRPLSPFLRPLPHDEPVRITIPTVANEPHHSLTVTLIPAGHCPGSVMLLLEGRGGTVLYTGDFRLSVGESSGLRALHHRDGTVKTLHSLHIDTTFCHRRVLAFPPRRDSAQAAADLVEDWLARGNNHLIHLLCPAKYGYEFVYRALHERFNMRVHVSRWKYRMYDTVPEIQDSLTTDATETWIHACDWRTDESSSNSSPSGGDGIKRQLPCRCVPYGVDTEPTIRLIKLSALFYTTYQTHKEVVQVSEGGTFCRVLLSMHASCSEVLDMVAYLRPRKVYPNVIPANSSKEEVLSLLHEALSQSGDHYSIEYDGRGGGGGGSGPLPLCRHVPLLTPTPHEDSPSLGSFKRQLPLPLPGANKRRRHSDTGTHQDVLLPPLPPPRGNIKGSLSLEGEPQHAGASSDHLTESSSVELLCGGLSRDCRGEPLDWRGTSHDSDCSSVFSDEVDSQALPAPHDGHGENSEISENADTEMRCNGGSMTEQQLALSMRESSSLTREDSVSSDCGAYGRRRDDKAGKRCRMWYKHHHFSTPVTEDLISHRLNSSSCGSINSRLTLRSSSLPDPHTLPLSHADCLLPPPRSPPLPLITVSSPPSAEPHVSAKLGVTDTACGEPAEEETRISQELEDAGDSDSGIFSSNNTPTNGDNRWEDSATMQCTAVASISRPTVIRTASAATLNTSNSTNLLIANSSAIPKADVPDEHSLSEAWNDSQQMSESATEQPAETQLSFPVMASRSSCLKTARRTAADLLEVVSLEQHHL